MNYSQISTFKKRATEMLRDGKRMYASLTKKSPTLAVGDKVEAAMHGLSKSAGKVLKASSYEEVSKFIPDVLDHYLAISLEYNKRL